MAAALRFAVLRLAAVLLALVPFAAAAQGFTGAMSGAWWDASRNGEGQFITFETVGARRVAYLAWFTYDAAGNASWQVGNADYAPGATSVTINLFSGSGARFGNDFRSADVRFTPSGTATLEFVSCDAMRLSHSGMTARLSLTRLVGPLAGAACGAAAPGPVAGFAGVASGAWWNATRDGEGQFVTVETVGARTVVYLAYFTYNASGAATWLVGSGDIAAGATRATIDLFTGSGPRFGDAYRAQDVRFAPAGNATLDFTSCSALRLAYAGTPSFTVDLSRLVGPLDGLPCADAASSLDAPLRFVLQQQGFTGNARAGRTLPAITDPLPQLGRLLFFSKALSAANDTACASCHHPSLGGGDALAISIGTGAAQPDLLGPGRRLASGPLRVGRNANTFFNVGLLDAGHFWDSRVESLSRTVGRNGAGGGIRTPDSPLGVADPRAGATLPAAQARFPVTGASEMLGAGFPGITGNDAIRAHLAARLGDYGTGRGALASSQWLARFRTAFAQPAGTAEQLVTFDNIAQAIAEYQRSATFADSPFARYARGENGAVSEEVKRGALLFFRNAAQGGAQCSQCHRGEALTGETLHALGFPQAGPGMGDGTGGTDDFGRGRETGRPAERYQFRTAPLLNVAKTGPWGHSGTYATLEEAIAHYLTPDATTAAFLAGRRWCAVPPLDAIDCAASVADVTRNTQAALAKMRADQAATPPLAMPVIDPSRLPATAVADIAAFLRSLTDPCLESRTCLAPWIPRADEAPDGHQLNAVGANGSPL